MIAYLIKKLLWPFIKELFFNKDALKELKDAIIHYAINNKLNVYLLCINVFFVAVIVFFNEQANQYRESNASYKGKIALFQDQSEKSNTCDILYHSLELDYQRTTANLNNCLFNQPKPTMCKAADAGKPKPKKYSHQETLYVRHEEYDINERLKELEKQ